MILDGFSDLNWGAVVVVAVVYFLLGFLWYSDALFGKQYRAAIDAEEGGSPPVPAIVSNLVHGSSRPSLSAS